MHSVSVGFTTAVQKHSLTSPQSFTDPYNYYSSHYSGKVLDLRIRRSASMHLTTMNIPGCNFDKLQLVDGMHKVKPTDNKMGP